MPPKPIEEILDLLDQAKRQFGAAERRRAEELLTRLSRRPFTDAASLIRFHEILLFMRAYPHDHDMRKKTEAQLAVFHRRVENLLEQAPAAFAALTKPEVAGIAGTVLSVNWGYDVVVGLAADHAAEIEIDWEVFENESMLVAVLKNFLPLFEDGAYVEYPVPYRDWIAAAKNGDESDLAWLLPQFDRPQLSARERAALYDGIKLFLMWDVGNSEATRTNMRCGAERVFYHREPLLKRADVSLAGELDDKIPLAMQRLSQAEGASFLRLARDAMSIRHRELHGFTYGDPQQVIRVTAGRGVDFYVWGVPPARRLPLLAYHAVLLVKNSVPCGYAESLSLFERTEFGFNHFYTFRDGESAWIYARLLRFFRQHLGLTAFSIDPYQIGFHNEEAVESGAFWFYRKLGFRPIKAELADLLSREEEKLAAQPGYRSPAGVLRKLATGHLLYEAAKPTGAGDWDAFHLRHIGLAIQRRLAQEFAGDRERLFQSSLTSVSQALGCNFADWKEKERKAIADLAVVFALIPDLAVWPAAAKKLILRLVRAKAGADESGYVRLLQKQPRLRQALIRLGSAGA